MNKNRYLLYLLICGFMFYIALPRLSLTVGGTETVFATAWLLLALLVFSGNLAAFLYSPRKRKEGYLAMKSNKKIRRVNG